MLNLKALTMAVVVGVLSPVVSMNVLNVPQVLAQTPKERKAEADRLLQQGLQQLDPGEYQAALQSFQQAYAIYREISDSRGMVGASLGMGYAYAYLGKTEKATEIFEWLLKVAQENSNSELEKLAQQGLQLAQNQNNPQKAKADQLWQQGLQQVNRSQFREALQSWQQALEIYREIGDRYGEAASLGSLGNVYIALGQYEKAIEFHQQSLGIVQEIGDPQGEGQSLNNLGIAYRSLGQYQKAIRLHQQSLAIAQKIGNRQLESQSLGSLGLVYHSLGEYQQAIEYHQQSLAIEKEIGDPQGEGQSLNNLGLAYRRRGQYQKAIRFHQQSLAIAQKIGNRQLEAQSLSSLGLIYDNLGQSQKAIEFHQQSLAIAQEIGARRGEVRGLNNLGVIYSSLGQHQKAIEFHQQSLAIKQEIRDRNGEAVSISNIGVAYFELGQYQKAIEFHQQSLDIAQEVGDQQEEANSLQGLGNTYSALKQYQKAIESYQQSIAIKQEIGDRNGVGITLYNLGRTLFRSGKPVEAEVELRKAIDVYESLRIGLERDSDKVSIFDTYLRSFRLLQIALVAQDKTDAALEISEKGRARSLIELMSERLNNNQQSLVPTTEPLNIEQIRQIAQNQNATFVQYSIASLRNDETSLLYIWVVKPTGEVTFKMVNLSSLIPIQVVVKRTGEVTFKNFNLSSLNTPLREIVDKSRIDIGARGGTPATVAFEPSEEFLQEQQAKQTANLRQLHDILIKPIADLLPTNPSEKVVFMPQGELYLVPFPALIDEQNQYLIEKHTILTSPSIQLLDIARKSHNEKRNNPASDILILGNPTMPEVWNPNSGEVEQLSALQGAYNEAVAIAEKFEVEPLVQGNATEPIVTQKMQNARLIHLATHGLLEYGIPEESGVLDAPGAIALAPSGDADGLLTSVEIYNMKLNAELVVLSACDTGRGKIAGEGVIGLSRAFLQAGVPSLIVSLWKVPDDSTQFLMTKFYEYWTEDTDKVVALRQAILETKEKYPEPINWAAFTLIGEAQ